MRCFCFRDVLGYDNLQTFALFCINRSNWPFFNATLLFKTFFGTLAEAIYNVAVAVFQVSAPFRLSHVRNLLQYRDVRLQETIHDVCSDANAIA